MIDYMTPEQFDLFLKTIVGVIVSVGSIIGLALRQWLKGREDKRVLEIAQIRSEMETRAKDNEAKYQNTIASIDREKRYLELLEQIPKAIRDSDENDRQDQTELRRALTTLAENMSLFPEQLGRIANRVEASVSAATEARDAVQNTNVAITGAINGMIKKIDTILTQLEDMKSKDCSEEFREGINRIEQELADLKVTYHKPKTDEIPAMPASGAKSDAIIESMETITEKDND